MSKYHKDENEWIGFKVNNITVIKKTGEKHFNTNSPKKAYQYITDELLCQCSCGKQFTVTAKALTSNNTKGCRGCDIRDVPIGKKFGKLTVIDWYCKKNKNNRSMVYWICKCDCGGTYEGRNENIKLDFVASCKKCRKSSNKFANKSMNPKRYFKSILAHANKRGISCLISEAFINNLLIKQNYKCALSGLNISYEEGNVSLDRINSDFGYTENNVQWVHRHVNFMKSEYSQDEYIRICEAVANHNRRSS